MDWIADTPIVDSYLAPPDVHEINRASAPGAGAAFILSLIFTVLHGLNLYLFLNSAPWVALIVHIVLVAVTAVITRFFILRHRDARFFMILLIAGAFLSVFGAGGTLLAILLYAWDRRSSLPFATWFDSIFPSRIERQPEAVYEDLMIGRDESVTGYSVIPFLDIMQVGTETEKREAISRMGERFNPAFAPAFHRALQDESNTIRVQAATAVARIERQFTERLLQLSGLYQRMPRNPDVVKALAEHYDAHAFTGILDAQRERLNREEALRLYQEYLQLAPQDEAARIHAGRLMLRNGEAERAAGWFADALREGFRSQSLMIWYAEALYAAGRYNELRAIAGQGLVQGADFAEPFRVMHPALAESFALWAGAVS